MSNRVMLFAVAALCAAVMARAQDDGKKEDTGAEQEIRVQVQQQLDQAKQQVETAQSLAKQGQEEAEKQLSGVRKRIAVTVDDSFDPTRIVTWAHGGAADLPKTRISFDLKDVPVKDAFTQVLKEAKLDGEVSDDVADKTITASAKNVTIGAALDLLSDIGGVGWAKQTVNGKTKVKVGKNVRISSAISLFGGGGGSGVSRGSTANPFGNYRVEIPNLRDSLFYSATVPGTRASFTCPHCKGKVTVMREPTIVKCPKCGEVLPSNWQYCPKDGTKRPSTNSDWRYCPLCGKPVDLDKIPLLKDSGVGRLFNLTKPGTDSTEAER